MNDQNRHVETKYAVPSFRDYPSTEWFETVARRHGLDPEAAVAGYQVVQRRTPQGARRTDGWPDGHIRQGIRQIQVLLELAGRSHGE